MGKKGKRNQGKGKKSKANGRGGDSTPAKNNKDWKKGKNLYGSFRRIILEDELSEMELRVKSIEPDGNCFFRAIGDQLFGSEMDHRTIRESVMQFIVDNRDMFEPFIEPCLDDDEDLDDYISRMKQLGSWAGDFEVQAASLLFRVDICIIQAGDDGLQCLCNKNPESDKTIHVSYHDGEHYNSVRKANDYGDGPAEPLQMEQASKGRGNDMSTRKWTWRDEKHLKENTGCTNEGIIFKFLEKHEGDMDLATESIIEWMRENDCLDDAEASSSARGNGAVDLPFTNADSDGFDLFDTSPSRDDSVVGDEEMKQNGIDVIRDEPPVSDGNPIVSHKKPANNKPCPCGSRKRYKHCCKIKEKANARKSTKDEDIDDFGDGSRIDATKQLSMLYI